jgi:hypothetical protein
MSPFEHGEVFVLDDGGEVKRYIFFIATCYWPLCESTYVVVSSSLLSFFVIFDTKVQTNLTFVCSLRWV